MIKQYYITIERIDYVDILDHFKGVESLFLAYRINKLLKLIKRNKNAGPFLDVGCGTGAVLRYLPKESVGLDINPWNLRKAKRYVPSAHLVLGDAENLPFKEDVFLTIVCTEVLEHLERPSEAIREIYRTLNGNGIFLGSVPRHSFLWELVDLLHRSLSNKKVRRLLNMFKLISSTVSYTAPIHKEYLRREVHELLSAFGSTKIGCDPLKLHVFFVARKF